MGKQAKQEISDKLKARYGLGTSSAVGQLLQSLPRDLFFCLRCMNLVRSLNRELGGSTLDRFLAFGASASKGSRICLDELSRYEAEALIVHQHEPFHLSTKKLLNIPVASEWDKGTYTGEMSIHDFLTAVYMRAMVWRQSLLLDFLHFLTGKGVDKNSRRLG